MISGELVGGLFHLSLALLKSFIPMQVALGFFQCGVDLVSGVWSGSSKDFCICCSYDISIGTKWIPRSQNDRADFLSRTYDSDDSAFLPRTDPTWGPHSIDRFANHLKA